MSVLPRPLHTKRGRQLIRWIALNYRDYLRERVSETNLDNPYLVARWPPVQMLSEVYGLQPHTIAVCAIEYAIGYATAKRNAESS